MIAQIHVAAQTRTTVPTQTRVQIKQLNADENLLINHSPDTNIRTTQMIVQKLMIHVAQMLS